MSDADEIRNRQRQYWNAISSGWKKWDAFIMEWFRPVGEKLLEMASLEEGFLVLDVATGSGGARAQRRQTDREGARDRCGYF